MPKQVTDGCCCFCVSIKKKTYQRSKNRNKISYFFFTYALRANFRCGYTESFRNSLAVLRLASRGDNALRIARVFFGRKSNGLKRLFL